MKTRWIAIVIVAALLAALPHGPLQAQERKLKIGLLAPITGINPDWGKKQVVGLEMALEKVNRRGGVNGVPVSVEIADTGGNPEKTLAAYRKLATQDGVLAVIGPLFSGPFKTISGTTNVLKTVVIATASATPGLSDLEKRPYAFRMTVTSEKKEEQLAKAWAEKHGVENVTVLYDENTTVTAAIGANVWPGIMKRLNIEILEPESPITLTSGEDDYRAQVRRAKAQQAQGLCIAAMPMEAGRIIREIRNQGMSQPILGASTTANPKTIEIAGTAAEGLWAVTLFYPGDPNPKVRKYVSAFQKRCGDTYPDMKCDPEQYDVAVHDILLFLTDIMKKKMITGDPAQLRIERDEIRDGLADMGVWRGTAGMMAFDKKGDGIRTAHVVVVKDGRWQPVK